LWVDVTAENNKVIGRSGGLGEYSEVDPWSHFVNIYMLDRNGNRIDRRNPQDIFTPLYNNQIPPGAAAVVHYAFTVPEDIELPFLIVEVKLQYRKFDTRYMQYVFGNDFKNDLPITTVAKDTIHFKIEGVLGIDPADFSSYGLRPFPLPSQPIPEWQRWNDY